jgi:hypothetical protein
MSQFQFLICVLNNKNAYASEDVQCFFTSIEVFVWNPMDEFVWTDTFQTIDNLVEWELFQILVIRILFVSLFAIFVFYFLCWVFVRAAERDSFFIFINLIRFLAIKDTNFEVLNISKFFVFHQFNDLRNVVFGSPHEHQTLRHELRWLNFKIFNVLNSLIFLIPLNVDEECFDSLRVLFQCFLCNVLYLYDSDLGDAYWLFSLVESAMTTLLISDLHFNKPSIAFTSGILRILSDPLHFLL